MAGLRGDLLLPITAFYTGLTAILYTGLFVVVVVYRYLHDCEYVDYDDKRLGQLKSAQVSFVQIMPFALFMLGVSEIDAIQGRAGLWVLGGLLLLFQILLSIHALAPQLPRVIRVAALTGIFCWFITVGVTMIVRDFHAILP
eukprot:jgi/Botrbrau1/942/Bobra.0167s0052.2